MAKDTDSISSGSDDSGAHVKNMDEKIKTQTQTMTTTATTTTTSKSVEMSNVVKTSNTSTSTMIKKPPPLSALLPQLRRPRADHDLGLIQDGWQKIRKGLAALEQFLGAGPYAFGASPTLADCAMVPMGYMIFRTMPELGVAAPFADYPRLDAWWANIRSNPHCAEALDWMAVEAIEFRKRREAEDAAKRTAS